MLENREEQNPSWHFSHNSNVSAFIMVATAIAPLCLSSLKAFSSWRCELETFKLFWCESYPTAQPTLPETSSVTQPRVLHPAANKIHRSSNTKQKITVVTATGFVLHCANAQHWILHFPTSSIMSSHYVIFRLCFPRVNAPLCLKSGKKFNNILRRIAAPKRINADESICNLLKQACVRTGTFRWPLQR